MKVYPLQVKELREFEGGPLGWWSKGHHEAERFLFAVAELSGKIVDAPVRLEWWRCVPAEGGSLLCRAKEGSRGAFPVTVVE
jgi:hypothetical protein